MDHATSQLPDVDSNGLDVPTIWEGFLCLSPYQVTQGQKTGNSGILAGDVLVVTRMHATLCATSITPISPPY